MSKWIAVWDKLPGDCEHCCPHEWVMVWNENDCEFAIARYVGPDTDGGEWRVLGKAALNAEMSVISPEEMGDIEDMKVTHWREIPLPKKKKSHG